MHPTWTLIIVVVLAALLFMRPGKISSLMEDLGKGISGFRKGMDEGRAQQQAQQQQSEPPRQVADQSSQSSSNNQDRVQS
ncbi:MAG: twin-arginine translocase TatA/TatE family subunit [Proteobacteria bacterium]|nr:twin-arginine translocase TatA/TatE family subunit [Pseudomonadota bacterium]